MAESTSTSTPSPPAVASTARRAAGSTSTLGDANIYKVNAATHQMQVFSNGNLLRTIPITTGKKPEFTTRSGHQVIMEKFDGQADELRGPGIASTDPEAYDIDDVQWAMRLTGSGEFIHAAPWSVGSQGYANVSHGCTGMSTDNAAWLYNITKRGDVVEYTGTDRYMDAGQRVRRLERRLRRPTRPARRSADPSCAEVRWVPTRLGSTSVGADPARVLVGTCRPGSSSRRYRPIRTRR